MSSKKNKKAVKLSKSVNCFCHLRYLQAGALPKNCKKAVCRWGLQSHGVDETLQWMMRKVPINKEQKPMYTHDIQPSV